MQTHNGHLARILHSCTDQAMNAALAQMELTAAQSHILYYLERCKTAPCPRDVEEAFQLSHPTVLGLLARLEKKGFIAFVPDANDRRCKRIHILPKGQECNETMYRTIQRIEAQMVKDFTPEEQSQFSSLLRRAISNMGVEPCKRKNKEDSQE